MKAILYLKRLFFLAIGCSFVGSSAEAATSSLIGNGSSWKYQIGQSEPSEPQEAWRSQGYNDATWQAGQAPIGYDTGGTPGVPAINTTIPTSLAGNYTSLYLRKTFTVANPTAISSLELTVNVDDGFVAWINGVEVGRANVPDGFLSYTAAAIAAEETRTVVITTSNLLVAGDNVLAIHALNANTSSSDLVVEAQLLATTDTTAPTIASILPSAAAVVQSLNSIEILFSENVQGVDASDLLINGVPATNVVFGAGPDQYVFTFVPPATGPVTVTFAASHGITDLAPIPNAFAGSTWNYTVDPNAQPATFIISEFLANNNNGIHDENGDASDWIEIFNPGTAAGNLEGWYLTDTATNLTKWKFPYRVVPPGGYLVVFASGKDRTNNPTGNLHTSFQLANGGEYLALVSRSTNVVSEFAPAYPAQRADVSWDPLESTCRHASLSIL